MGITHVSIPSSLPSVQRILGLKRKKNACWPELEISQVEVKVNKVRTT